MKYDNNTETKTRSCFKIGFQKKNECQLLNFSRSNYLYVLILRFGCRHFKQRASERSQHATHNPGNLLIWS